MHPVIIKYRAADSITVTDGEEEILVKLSPENIKKFITWMRLKDHTIDEAADKSDELRNKEYLEQSGWTAIAEKVPEDKLMAFVTELHAAFERRGYGWLEPTVDFDPKAQSADCDDEHDPDECRLAIREALGVLLGRIDLEG